MIPRSLPLVLISFALLSMAAAAPVHYTPNSGDYFTYYEVENLGNGTGNYQGYTEHTVVNGMERIVSVNSNGVVHAYYHYSWTYSNSTGQTLSGQSSGNYTFSYDSFLYLNGTDNQTGYVNPTVWFYMNNSLPVGSSFYLLNTRMTVESTDLPYHLPTQGRTVKTIFTQGKSSYLRNDSYGYFNAVYTWDAYFDPATGFIVGYEYTEQDSNSSGSGFTYTDTLNVNNTSYPLTQAEISTPLPGGFSGSGLIEIGFSIGIIALIAVVVLVVVFRRRKSSEPRHSQQPGPVIDDHSSPPPPAGPPESIDLTPKEAPVQQIVIKEVVKVKCSYCGALMDSTAQNCPVCGAPRT